MTALKIITIFTEQHWGPEETCNVLELNQTSDSKHAFTAPSKRAPRLTARSARHMSQLRPHDRNPKCPRRLLLRVFQGSPDFKTVACLSPKEHTHMSGLVSKAWEAGHGCCGPPSPQGRPHNGDIHRRHTSGLTFWRNVIYCCLQFATSHGAGPREGHE